jgi:hypothetical protein
MLAIEGAIVSGGQVEEGAFKVERFPVDKSVFEKQVTGLLKSMAR